MLSLPTGARAIDSTFEFSFTFPKAANRGDRNGRKNKAEKGGPMRTLAL